LILIIGISGRSILKLKNFDYQIAKSAGSWNKLYSSTDRLFDTTHKISTYGKNIEIQNQLKKIQGLDKEWKQDIDDFETALFTLANFTPSSLFATAEREQVENILKVWVFTKRKLKKVRSLFEQLIKSPIGEELLKISHKDWVEHILTRKSLHKYKIFFNRDLLIFYRLEDALTDFEVSSDVFTKLLKDVSARVSHKTNLLVIAIITLTLLISTLIIAGAFILLNAAVQSLRESEERFRDLFNNMSSGVAIYVAKDNGNDFIFKDFNRGGEKIEGVKRENIIGRSVVQVFSGVKEFGLLDVFKRVWQTGTPEYHPISLYKDNRISSWRENYIYKLSTGEIVAIYDDVTARVKIAEEKKQRAMAEVKASVEHAKAVELRNAYNQLKRTQEKLIRTERLAALGKLSGGIAHELRTPLGVIRNSVYFLNLRLKEFAKDKKVRKHLDILNEEVKISDNLIEDIIAFTQVKIPALRKIDCNEILDKARERIDVPKNVNFIINCDKKHFEVFIDKDQATQLFSNIFLNSIQAMPDGGKITISLLEKKGYLEISIEDSGIGIAKKELGSIFEPLFTTKTKGLGLGLAICENIVKNHNGSIRVRSKEGQGTEVIIKLPKDKEKT